VPDKALVVYETSQFGSSWKALQQKKIWKTLSTLAPVNELNESLSRLDSTNNGKGLINLLAENNKLIIALFPINRSALGSLFVLEIKNIDQHAAISNLLEQNYTRKSRKYNGFTISEITHKKNEQQFTFIFYKNYFIGSSTSFLVEDAIRTINDSKYLSFKESYGELFSLAKLRQDDGNLYINTSKTDDLVGLFYKGTKNDLSFFNRVASSSFLDIATSESDISLNGFSILKKETDFLNVFKDNPANSFSVANLVSNDAYGLRHYSFTHQRSFLENLNSYRKTHEISYNESQKILQQFLLVGLEMK